MKKLLITVLLCAATNLLGAEELTTKITHIDASGFPVIEAMLRIYSDQQPEINLPEPKILENDTEIGKFTLAPQNFSHYLVLLLDRSSSIEEAMPDVKNAAVSLVDSLAAVINISLMSFGSDIDIDHDFSQNRKSLDAAILKIRPWGGTALFDALYDSCEELNKRAGLNDLKTIICLTDGQDSTPSGQHRLSRHEPHEVTKIAVDSNIRVINLGLGNDIDIEFLSGLASATGGWYLQTATSDQLTNLCARLSRRLKLKRHYRLSYNSPLPASESPRRTLKVSISHNSMQAESTRTYHVPTQVKALAVETASEKSNLSIEELLEHFAIEETDRMLLAKRLRLPQTEPVYGLTLASFNGLSVENCRELINQAHQAVANKHQQNFNRRKSYLDEHLHCVDNLLKLFYSRAEESRVSESEQQKIARFIEFLDFRREEIELMSKQAYEEYLIDLKFSQAELEYFEKTQVGREKFSEAFFAGNLASRTLALQNIGNQFVELTAANQQQLREKFAVSGTGKSNSSSASSSANLENTRPALHEIRPLD
jgi:hypothetical protein